MVLRQNSQTFTPSVKNDHTGNKWGTNIYSKAYFGEYTLIKK